MRVLVKKATALVVVNALIVQPYAVLAQDIQALGGTSVGQTANGVPLVNIAAPSAAGVSQNQYQSLNVKHYGAVFNNATQDTTTVIGGGIRANKNLRNSGSAKIILNEVRGTSQSSLNGYMEVGGNRADLVIANPNGITCNGCGFVNVANATLTTGIAKMVDGRLDGFNVSRGAVTVEGKGMDASGTNKLDIISRAVQLNAKVHANDLSMRLGRDGAGQGQVPKVALDSSVLGGMYANKIKVVGTEKGLGINLPPEVQAGIGGVDISASGKVQVQKVSSAGDVAVASNAGSVTVQKGKQVYSASKVSMDAADRIDVLESAQVIAEKDVVIKAGSVANNSGSIFAGVKKAGGFNDAGRVAISANTGITNTATAMVVSTREVAFNSPSIHNHKGSTVASFGAVDIRGDLVRNDGAIDALADASISSKGVYNTGRVTSGQSLAIQSQEHIHNTGQLSAADEISLHSKAVINQGGEISAENVKVTGNALANKAGRLIAISNLYLNSGKTTNVGDVGNKASALMMAGASVSVGSTEFTNDNFLSFVAATNAVTFIGQGEFNNNGVVVASSVKSGALGKADQEPLGTLPTGQLLAAVDYAVVQNKALIAAGLVDLSQRSVSTSRSLEIQSIKDVRLGRLNGAEDVSVNAGGNVDFTKAIASAGSISLIAGGAVVVGDKLNAKKHLVLSSDKAITAGNIQAGQNVVVDAGQTAIVDQVDAGGGVFINSATGDARLNTLKSGADATLMAGGNVFSGTVMSGGKFTVGAGANAVLSNAVKASGNVLLTSEGQLNVASIASGGSITGLSGDAATITGVQSAVGDIFISSDKNLTLNQSAVIQGNTVSVVSGGLLNAYAKVQGRGDVALRGKAGLLLTELVQAGNNITLSSDKDISSSGAGKASMLLAGGGVRVFAGDDISLRTAGIRAVSDVGLYAERNIVLAHSLLTSSSTIHSTKGNITLSAGQDINAQVIGLHAGKNLGLYAGRNISLNPVRAYPLLSAGEGLVISADQVLRAARSRLKTTKGDILISTGSTLDVGSLSAGRNLTVASKGSAYLRGSNFARKNMTVTADANAYIYGNSIAGGDLTLSGQNYLYVRGTQKAGANLALSSSKGWINSYRDLIAGRDIVVSAKGNAYLRGNNTAGQDVVVVSERNAYVYGRTKAGRDIKLLGANYLYQGGVVDAGRDAVLGSSNGYIYSRGSRLAKRDLTVSSKGRVYLYGNSTAGRNIYVNSDTENTYIYGNTYGRGDLVLSGKKYLYVAGDVTAGQNAQLFSEKGHVYTKGRIGAGRDLTVSAGNSLYVRGKANYSANGDVKVLAANDISIAGQLSHYYRNQYNHGSTWTRGYVVSRAGDVLLQAGRDISTYATDIRAKDTVMLNAGRNINLLERYNTVNTGYARTQYSRYGYDYKTRKVGGYRYTRQPYQVRVAYKRYVRKAVPNYGYRWVRTSRWWWGGYTLQRYVRSYTWKTVPTTAYRTETRYRTITTPIYQDDKRYQYARNTQTTDIHKEKAVVATGSRVYGDNVVLNAKGNINLVAAQVNARDTASLIAGGAISMRDAINRRYITHTTKVKTNYSYKRWQNIARYWWQPSNWRLTYNRQWVTGSSKTSHGSRQTTAKTSILGGNLVHLSSGASLSLKDFYARKNLNLISTKGHVNISGRIYAGGDLSIQSVKYDVNLNGTPYLTAQNNLSISAGRNVNIAAQNRVNYDYRRYYYGYNRSGNTHYRSSTQYRSYLTARNGNLSIAAKQDINAKAVSLSARNTLSLAAGRNVNLNAGYNVYQRTTTNRQNLGRIAFSSYVTRKLSAVQRYYTRSWWGKKRWHTRYIYDNDKLYYNRTYANKTTTSQYRSVTALGNNLNANKIELSAGTGSINATATAFNAPTSIALFAGAGINLRTASSYRQNRVSTLRNLTRYQTRYTNIARTYRHADRWRYDYTRTSRWTDRGTWADRIANARSSYTRYGTRIGTGLNTRNNLTLKAGYISGLARSYSLNGDLHLQSGRSMSFDRLNANKVTLISGGSLGLRQAEARNQMYLQARYDINANNARLISRAGGMQLTAGRDVNLNNSDVWNYGRGKALNIAAGRNINLGAKRITHKWRSGITNYTRAYDDASYLYSRGDLFLTAGNNITAKGTRMVAWGKLKLAARNIITINPAEDFYAYNWSRSWTKRKWWGKKTHYKQSRNYERLTNRAAYLYGSGGIEIVGARGVVLNAVSLRTNRDLVIRTNRNFRMGVAQNKTLNQYHYSRNSSWLGWNYSNRSHGYKQTNITHQGSIADAMGNVNAMAGGRATLVNAHISAGKRAYIKASGVALLSAYDTVQREVTKDKSSFGSLLTSTETEKSLKVKARGSSIKANAVEIEAQVIALEGSRIEAKSIELAADVVKLISAKNTDQYSKFSDGSGVLLRKIQNKGHVKEQAVESLLQAEKIVLNGQALAGEKLSKDGLLQAISSEMPNLSAKELEQVKAVLQDKEWDQKTTTLSTLGQLIVQAITTAIAPGIGDVALQGIGNAFIESVVKAAINNLSRQLTSQILTAAITGNRLELDLGNLAESSIKAGLTAGLTEQVGGYIAKAEMSKMGSTFANTVSRAAISAAVNGGDFEDVLKQMVVDEVGAYVANYIGDSAEAGSLTHVISHTALGCALGELTQKDCGSGAAGAFISANLAHHIGGLVDDGDGKLSAVEKKQVAMYTDITSSVLATIANKDATVASYTAKNEVNNNYLNHAETMLRDSLRNRLKACQKSGKCDKATVDDLEATLAKIDKTDKERDQAFAEACRWNKAIPACSKQSVLYLASRKTWVDFANGTMSAEERKLAYDSWKANPQNDEGINEYFQTLYPLADIALYNRWLTSSDPKIQSQRDYAERVGSLDVIGIAARLLGSSPEQADIVALATGVGTLAYVGRKFVVKPKHWTVDPSFKAADETAGVLVNGSYVKNPTARNLSDSVMESGKIKVDGQLANGQYMYVVDSSGNIVIGTRSGQRMPHPTLVGGQNPQVQAAGIVDIRGGKIYSVDNASGHFKPGSGSLKNAESSFGELPSNAFHKDFKGYVPYDD